MLDIVGWALADIFGTFTAPPCQETVRYDVRRADPDGPTLDASRWARNEACRLDWLAAEDL